MSEFIVVNLNNGAEDEKLYHPDSLVEAKEYAEYLRLKSYKIIEVTRREVFSSE